MSVAKYLVYTTIVATFVLIVWGAYLTAGNWGGDCGAGGALVSSDWPFCNGSLAIPNPATNYGALVEYIHRTLSVVVGVLLLVATVAVWRARPKATGARRALLLAILLLIVQIGLGDVVVNSDLNAPVTALHLANATALFGLMVVAGVLMNQHGRPRTLQQQP